MAAAYMRRGRIKGFVSNNDDSFFMFTSVGTSRSDDSNLVREAGMSVESNPQHAGPSFQR